MNFKVNCLHCRKPVTGINYDFNSNKKNWSNQYRMIDIDLELGINRQLFTQSFKHYSFGNPEGLLQYKGLPYPHTLPEIGETAGLTPLQPQQPGQAL